MKVILLQDVKKVGKKDAIVDVSDGYATNYLIKNKLAVSYTKHSKEVLEKELDKRKQAEDELITQYMDIKKQLEDRLFSFKVKTGTNDKVFGKVSTKQISAELKKAGYAIDKKNIILDSDLSTLGVYEVVISLHKKVNFKIRIELKK